MVTGSDMEDFGKTFGVSAKGWSVEQTVCSLGVNALWPGEEANFTFHVKTADAFRGARRPDVVRYGTRAAGRLVEAGGVQDRRSGRLPWRWTSPRAAAR